MYAHIGNEFLVREAEVIGVFDIDKCSVGKRTRKFFFTEQSRGRIIYATDELPRAFVVTGEKTYISGISSSTIQQRMKIMTEKNDKQRS